MAVFLIATERFEESMPPGHSLNVTALSRARISDDLVGALVSQRGGFACPTTTDSRDCGYRSQLRTCPIHRGRSHTLVALSLCRVLCIHQLPGASRMGHHGGTVRSPNLRVGASLMVTPTSSTTPTPVTTQIDTLRTLWYDKITKEKPRSYPPCRRCRRVNSSRHDRDATTPTVSIL